MRDISKSPPLLSSDGLLRVCKWSVRGLAILFFSILITLPFVAISIEIAGYIAMEKLGIDESKLAGKDDLGSGFIIISYLFVAAIGSFIVVLPFAVWLANRLANRLLRNHFKFLNG